MRENERIKATANFVVGGVTQTISTWLAGDVGLKPDQLMDQLASIVDKLNEPRLFSRLGTLRSAAVFGAVRCRSR